MDFFLFCFSLSLCFFKRGYGIFLCYSALEMKRPCQEESIALTVEDLTAIASGVQRFLSLFPQERSHFKAECVRAIFSDWLSHVRSGNAGGERERVLSAISELSQYAPSYVDRLMRAESRSPELFTQAQPLNVERPRLQLVRNAMANFVIDAFDMTPSGSVRPRLAVQRSFLNGYNSYFASSSNVGGGYKMFLNVCQQMHVGMAKHDLRDAFSCPHCKGSNAWRLRANELQKVLANGLKLGRQESEELQELQAKLDLLKYHQELSAAMRQADRDVLENLIPGEMLAHGDFTTFPVVSDGSFLGVYVLVFRWREVQDGPIFSSVLYCIPSDMDASKDKDFVSSTFRALFAADFFKDIQRVTHFSDTGTAHFRNANSLYLFSLLQQTTGIQFRVCVYPSYHGHNLCDSNAGVAKKIVNHQAQGLEVTGALWDRSFLLDCLNMQRGAQVMQIPIEVNPKFVRPLEDISQFHDFTFDDNGSVLCRNWPGDIPKIQKFKFL